MIAFRVLVRSLNFFIQDLIVRAESLHTASIWSQDLPKKNHRESHVGMRRYGDYDVIRGVANTKNSSYPEICHVAHHFKGF